MDYDTAFKQLKNALVDAPVLAIPDFGAVFVVKTNASDIAVGAVLIQHDQVVVFMPKVLNSAQNNYQTMDSKLFTIVLPCKKWHPYLDFKKAVVLIDHKPLIGIDTAPNSNKII